MNVWQLMRYSLSDLGHRRLMAMLTVAALGISVVYILVMGFYGSNTHLYQKRVLEESGPAEKVVATVPTVTDTAQWFTADRIRDLGHMKGVRLAFPCIELNLDVSLDGQRYDWLPFESTARGDPTTDQAPENRTWSCPL